MTTAWLIWGVVLVWYSFKAVRTNPNKPNWNKAIAAALLWPSSLFVERYNWVALAGYLAMGGDIIIQTA